MAEANTIPVPPRIKDRTGLRFGRLSVIGLDSVRKRPDGRGTRTFWVCKCDCGLFTVCDSSHLAARDTQSCGCLKLDSHNATHGQTGTRLYAIWSSMKGRCTNPENGAYDDYGGRGVAVCNAWMQFEVFRDWALANGYRDDLTIDRHPDPNGNYEPNNCRWATWFQQQRNRRNTIYVTYKGKRLPLAELAEQFGIKHQTLRGRIVHGWDLEKAIQTPVKVRRSTANVDQ